MARTPWSNTVAYYPLTSSTTTSDMKTSGTKYNLTQNGGSFGTYAWVSCYYSPSWTNYLKWNVWDITQYSHTISLRVYKTWGSNDMTVYQFWKWGYAWRTEWVQRPSFIRSFYWNDDIDSPNSYNSGEWLNIICCFDKSSSKQSMYINWSKIWERTTTNTHWPLNYTNDFYILWWIHTSNTYDSNIKLYWYASGFIIENKARTEQEIQNYFNDTKYNYWFKHESTIIYGNKDIKEMYLWTPWARRRLPSAYQEVEYIQSSRTQVINTWVIPTTQTYTAELEIESLENWQEYWAFGIWWNTGFRAGQDTSWHWDTSYWALYSPSSYALNTKTKVTVSNSWKGTSSNTALWLFWMWENGSYSDNRKGAYKIYYCNIWNSGNLIRKFIPCYRKSDNVIWMYDLVNNTFYTNAWIWTFTKGADVNYDFTAIKEVYYWSKKIRPAWWTPWSNTVAYYPLNNVYTNTDQSWHKYNWTTTWTLTYSTNYCQFSAGNYISIPKVSPYWSSPFTQSIWFNSPDTSWHQNFFYNQFNSSTDNSAEWLLIYSGKLQYWAKGSRDWSNVYSVNNNTWYNVIITYTWSQLKMYVNGSLVWTKSRTISSTTPNYFWIGRGGEVYSSVYCVSKLSEFIIENKERTATEVQNYYNLTKSDYWL